MLTLWSKDLVLCTDGPAELSDEQRTRLAHHNIPVREESIARLEGTPNGALEHRVFVTEETLPRHTLFFNTGQFQRFPLFSKLGCDFTGKGGYGAGTRRKRTSRGCTWQATPHAMCSLSSSRRPKARKRPWPSIKRFSGRTGFVEIVTGHLRYHLRVYRYPAMSRASCSAIGMSGIVVRGAMSRGC